VRQGRFSDLHLALAGGSTLRVASVHLKQASAFFEDVICCEDKGEGAQPERLSVDFDMPAWQTLLCYLYPIFPRPELSLVRGEGEGWGGWGGVGGRISQAANSHPTARCCCQQPPHLRVAAASSRPTCALLLPPATPPASCQAAAIGDDGVRHRAPTSSPTNPRTALPDPAQADAYLLLPLVHKYDFRGILGMIQQYMELIGERSGPATPPCQGPRPPCTAAAEPPPAACIGRSRAQRAPPPPAGSRLLDCRRESAGYVLRWLELAERLQLDQLQAACLRFLQRGLGASNPQL
jgi:hypothetical protein